MRKKKTDDNVHHRLGSADIFAINYRFKDS